MGRVWRDLCLNRVAVMCYGAPSGALRAPELAESPVLLILMLSLFGFLHCSNISPTSLPNGSPNGSNMAPNQPLKSIQEPLGELLEPSGQPGGLLEDSWNALGALLDASRPIQSN